MHTSKSGTSLFEDFEDPVVTNPFIFLIVLHYLLAEAYKKIKRIALATAVEPASEIIPIEKFIPEVILVEPVPEVAPVVKPAASKVAPPVALPTGVQPDKPNILSIDELVNC
ncbi:hypothetical protein C1645_823765 [Glomus cerebriforme]|uniref:Uncharacterized protein n=1 Tax=Glomus cerebriforme TaxID=658196 RepID=A0A397SVR7_9GLOM|nr:hypothetical protein C1645_823765 [Glomus cerebriforme]